MAVARPQVGGGTTGIKIALIVFICLTLGSLTLAIIAYTHYEGLNNDIQDAQGRLNRASQQASETKQQMRDMAMIMIGESTDNQDEIRQAINTTVDNVLGDERVQKANIPQDSAILTVLQELYSLFKQNAQELEDIISEYNNLNNQLDQLNKDITATQKQFEDKTRELETQFAALEQKSNQNHEEWKKQITELTTEVEQEAQKAAETLDNERKLVSELNNKATQQEELIKQLLAEQAKYQPRADQLAALQTPDGQILKVVTGADIVYIDLGRQHGIKRKMTFSVHSAYQAISANGKGKANIEVVRPFETTSECRVTSTTEGEPVVVGDLVANPVFDRSRQYNFAVAGDFDLDFDGNIEDPGGSQVKMLIRQWGGKIVSKIDTRTDFVVLGAAPPLPITLPEGTADEMKERNAERQKARDLFDSVLQEAQALSIPILTRTQFLHFVGYGVPAHAEEDRPFS
ncbi:MAG: hypothetical protein JSV03_13155 [Planctomycetota bacterium]|nr:MAG: hypothetical protein JSV03_13155 [Planctomycetota bacterium]